MEARFTVTVASLTVKDCLTDETIAECSDPYWAYAIANALNTLMCTDTIPIVV